MLFTDTTRQKLLPRKLKGNDATTLFTSTFLDQLSYFLHPPDRRRRKEMLISAAVNEVLLLGDNVDGERIQNIYEMMTIILMFEACAKVKLKLVVSYLKLDDFVKNKTEALHFLRKRIPCSCLDTMYQEWKKISGEFHVVPILAAWHSPTKS